MPYTRILVTCLILITTCFHGLGQYNTPQNNVWVFGRNAGIDFNSGAPVPFTSGFAGGILQGSAMVSDNAGNLLFYTNGKTVWNRAHDTMLDGADIVPFNTYYARHSSVIVPLTGSTGKYYIFSLETSLDGNIAARSHLAYSIVDMSLDGGLGGVTAAKGIIIDSLLSEKMEVVAGNNCDYWLMVYKRYSAQFLSYHITSFGIDLAPVVSPGIGGVDSMGTLKVNYDRRYVVNVNYGSLNSDVVLCDLDPVGGHVSGCRLISNSGAAYAAEFSPNSSKLYVNGGPLYQYDISLPTMAAIIASRYTIPAAIDADLKLAPDGRIYTVEAAASATQYLNCIRNPDMSGAACNYVYHDLNIAPNFETHVLPATYWSPVTGIVPGPISGNSMVCTGASIVLSNAVPGGIWSSSSSSIATVSTTGVVSGVTAGIVSISYSNNCGVASTTITVNPTPILSPAAATVCIGGNLSLSFGPTGGTWSQSVTGIVSVDMGGTVHAGSVGNTIVTYTLPGNCYSITSIAVNDIPVISPPAVTLCANASTALSFSPAGGMWASSSTSVAVADPAGVVHGIGGGSAVLSYSLGGCTTSSSVTIDPAPDVAPLFSKLCIGTTLQISSSIAGGTWSSSADAIASVSSSGNVAALSVGTAIVSYSAIGCAGLATVAVMPPPTGISGRALLCQGYSTQFSNGVAGGTWSSGAAGIAAVDAAGNVTGIGMGSTLISYTTAAGAGCSTVYSVTVIPSAGAGTITGPVNVCVGNSIALSDAVAGGVWSSDDAGLATMSASGIVSGVAGGSVTIRYTVTDTCGIAIAFKTLTIGTLPDAGVIAGDSVLCLGNATALSHSVNGGSWFSSNAAVASVSAGGVVTGVATGIVLIGYGVSNDCGSDTAWYPVRVAPGPSAGAIVGLTRVCIGATFQLSNATAGGAWTTSPVGVVALSSSGDVTAVGQGIRIITYTIGPDANGCVGIATHSVTVSTVASFTVAATVTQPLCYGDTTGAIALAVLGDMPPYRYLWSTLDTTASLTHLKDGTYYSSVTETATRCNVPDTFHITTPPQLSMTLTTSGDKCNTGVGSVAANVTGGISPYTYAWSNSALISEISSLHAGLYSVSATDVNGCVKSAETTLADTCGTLVIHDAITPNGDGINDVWVIEGIAFYPASTVQVFDKWGDLLYEKTNYQNDWAATGKNHALPDGTYYYLIRLNKPNSSGGPDTFTGSILVKR